MEIILTIFYCLLFVILIKRVPFFQTKHISSYFLVLLFLIKVLCGIVLFFIYTYYYDRNDADIFRLFDDAKAIYSAFPDRMGDYCKMILGIGDGSTYFQEHYYNQMIYWTKAYNTNIFSDTHFLIRFNALVMLFSFGYFNVHTIFGSFLSFFGLFCIYKFFEKNTYSFHKLQAIILFLLPSTLFWTSSVLKESYIICGIGIFIYSFFLLCQPSSIGKKIWYCFCFLFSIYLISHVKLYYLVILLPLCCTFLFNKKNNIQHPLITYALLILICIPATFFIIQKSGYDILNMMAFKHNDMLNLAICKNAKVVSYEYLDSTWCSFIQFFPKALFFALCFPLPFTHHSLMMILSEVENIVLLLWLVTMLALGFKKHIKYKNLFWFCFLVSLGNVIIIGYCSPLIGALVRYRSTTLPFFMLAALFLCDEYKLKKHTKNILKKLKINSI